MFQSSLTKNWEYHTIELNLIDIRISNYGEYSDDLIMSTYQVLAVLVAAVVFLFLMKTQKLKEQANRIAGQLCRRNDLQFLDGTVAFRGLHFDRSSCSLVYRFRFEYSVSSADRYAGSISFIGNQMQNLFIAPEHLKPRDYQ